MATQAEVRKLLAGTTLPAALVDGLLDGTSATWLLGVPADVLAGDLALCHPELAEGEVRAAVKPTTQPGTWRLTVVAHDRPGLLAATAGSLAFHGLSVASASAASWPELGLSLQCVVAVDPGGRGRIPAEWDDVGATLRAALTGTRAAAPDFHPAPPVWVESTAQGQGRCLVSVEATDQVGLLWAMAHWFETHGCNIEAATMTTEGIVARDTLLVVGEVDTHALATELGGAGEDAGSPWTAPTAAAKWAMNGALAGAGLAAAIALRGVRVAQRKKA